MRFTTLTLPEHAAKPRTVGLTMAIDGGVPTRYFQDVVASFPELIDVVKFGWGTSLVTDDLKYKIDALVEANVDFYFGGTLFEAYLLQDRFDDWRRLCDRYGCRSVEISNGTIPLSNADKAGYIQRLRDEYRVFSEVGFKDPVRSDELSPQAWLDYINQDLDAGAFQVITEARESGRSGICDRFGELRGGVLDAITDAGVDVSRLLFEAPNKELQTALIRRFGSQVNLGNIALGDLVGVETLRLGLRGDTVLDFADPQAVAAVAAGARRA